MKRLALTISAVAGLVLGLLIGAGVGAAMGGTHKAPIDEARTAPTGDSADPPVAVQGGQAERTPGATWTYRGELAHVELPLDFEVTRNEIETDFGYQSDFTSTDGVLTIETAPRLAETTLTLAEVADRFATANDGTVDRRVIGDVEIYAVTSTAGGDASSQYFFTKDEMTYGLRSNAGSLEDQGALLDSLVASLTRNEGPPTPTPTMTPTPEPEAPPDCAGDGAIPMAISNVDKYANARDRASPDADIVERVPLGTVVTWTGEKLKNGRFTWHEVYYPDVDACVWIAHTLLEQTALPATPIPMSTDPIPFGARSIAGLPIGTSTEVLIDQMTELIGPPAGPFDTPPDGFWGPFRVGCFSFMSWDKIDVVICDDGTTAGWLVETDAPANIELDVGTRNSVAHWRKLGSWPDDTTAYFRLDVERWIVTSESLGITGAASADTDQPIERESAGSGAASASEVLPSSTTIESIWNLDFGG